MILAKDYIVIKAIFIGANGSMGYKKGIEYHLKIVLGTQIKISRFDLKYNYSTGGYCPYNSLEAFLKNWQLTEENITPSFN